MSVFGFLLANLSITLVMLVFSLSWDAIAAWRGGRLSQPIHDYRPARSAWSAFYWQRARTYLFSYLFVLGLFMLFPLFFGRRQVVLGQLISLAQIVPGLAGYFVLAGLVRPRITFYPEGFRCSAAIPLLPGRRDRETGTYSSFRVGVRFWRDYRDAVPRGNVLILRQAPPDAANLRHTFVAGTELIIPRGERDRLLDLARAGLKKAKEERRRSRRNRRPAGTGTED